MQASILAHIHLGHEFEYIKKKGFSQPSDLCHLMSSFGSDKGNPLHNYTVAYDWLFSRFRNEELALFELGIGTNKIGAPSTMGPAGKPGASLRGWAAYFPNARIVGADVDRDILFEEERIQTFWTDQTDPNAIRELWEKLDDVWFDIMVDDGLHEVFANVRFLIGSFQKLRPGGIYVIEDITPNDAEFVSSLATCMAPACTSIVYEMLYHPLNNVDNRLIMFQKA